MLASAFAVPFNLLELEDAPAECHLGGDTAEVIKGTYHGGLTLKAISGILVGCTVDRTILEQAEGRYVTAINALIKQALPGGVCKPDTYAKVIYDTFAKTRAAPKGISEIELQLMTNWCRGVIPADGQLAE